LLSLALMARLLGGAAAGGTGDLAGDLRLESGRRVREGDIVAPPTRAARRPAMARALARSPARRDTADGRRTAMRSRCWRRSPSAAPSPASPTRCAVRTPTRHRHPRIGSPRDHWCARTAGPAPSTRCASAPSPPACAHHRATSETSRRPSPTRRVPQPRAHRSGPRRRAVNARVEAGSRGAGRCPDRGTRGARPWWGQRSRLRRYFGDTGVVVDRPDGSPVSRSGGADGPPLLFSPRDRGRSPRSRQTIHGRRGHSSLGGLVLRRPVRRHHPRAAYTALTRAAMSCSSSDPGGDPGRHRAPGRRASGLRRPLWREESPRRHTTRQVENIAVRTTPVHVHLEYRCPSIAPSPPGRTNGCPPHVVHARER